MTNDPNALVKALLERHGMLFSSEIGIDLGRNSPAALFQWLCATLVLSARISSQVGLRAAGELRKAGWTSAQRLGSSTWQERVEALDRAGYVRYDEKTATMLGDLAGKVMSDYRGDLRRLRDAAGRDPGRERALITRFKGIGEVGADIFFREVQAVWDEVYPFADRRALRAAKRLDLASTARQLAETVGREDFPDFWRPWSGATLPAIMTRFRSLRHRPARRHILQHCRDRCISRVASVEHRMHGRDGGVMDVGIEP